MIFFLFFLNVFCGQESINYASNQCGAFILYSSPSLKRSSSILDGSADRYMLGETPASFIVIRLCNEVLISTIVVECAEWLSSFPHHMKFSVLDKNAWVCIAEVKLCMTRNKQTFKITRPHQHSSVLAVQLVGTQGPHRFFTLTSIQVYGRTLIEEFKPSTSTNPYSIMHKNNLLYSGHHEIDMMHKIAAIEHNLYYVTGITLLLTLILAYILYKKIEETLKDKIDYTDRLRNELMDEGNSRT